MSYDIARKVIYEKRMEAFTIPEIDEFYPATETQVVMDQFGAISICTRVVGGPLVQVGLDVDGVAAIRTATPPDPE